MPISIRLYFCTTNQPVRVCARWEPKGPSLRILILLYPKPALYPPNNLQFKEKINMHI